MLKDLIKNFSTLAIGTLGSKFLTLLIIPIYTSVLSTTDIGKYDLINTIISMAIPLLTLNVAEGVLRYLLDKDYSVSDVKRIGHKYVWMSIVIFSLLVFMFFLISTDQITMVQSLIVIALYASDVWYNYFLREKRGEGLFKPISIAGILNTVCCFVLCCLFLLVFKMGLEGYAMAYVLGNTFACIYLFYAGDRQQTSIGVVNGTKKENVEKAILSYSIPLIINALSWWVNDYSDRYVVIWLCGMSASGIYSLAYKIPAILNIIQTVFNQAWIVSTVKAEEEGNVTDVVIVYKLYRSTLFIGCAMLLFLTKFIATLLYAKDFFTAWVYTPYLITAIIYNSLSGCIGGILAAKKKTKIYSLSTFAGAIANIILNIVLVRKFGVIGAAIATLVSCILVYIIRIVYLKWNRIITLNAPIQYLISIPLLLLMFAVRFEWPILLQVALLVINLFVNLAIILGCLRRRKNG